MTTRGYGDPSSETLDAPGLCGPEVATSLGNNQEQLRSSLGRFESDRSVARPSSRQIYVSSSQIYVLPVDLVVSATVLRQPANVLSGKGVEGLVV